MKVMKRRFHILGMLLLVTVIVGLIVQYFYLSDKLIEDRQLILQQVNTHSQHEINNDISLYKDYVNIAAEVLTAGEWSEVSGLDLFNRLRRINPSIKAIFYGGEDKGLIITHDWPQPHDFDVRQRPWYIEAIKSNQVIVSDAYPDLIDGKPVITISKALLYEDGNVIGALGLDINIEDIIIMVEDTKIKNTGYSFLLDGNGNILAHPKYKYDPEPEGEQVKLLSEEIEDKIKENKSGQMKAEIEGIEGYLNYKTIDNTNWIIANFISLNELKDNNWDIWRMFLITLAIGTLIFAMFAYLQKENFMKPVLRLDIDIGNIDIENNIGYRLPIFEKDPFTEIRKTINSVIHKTQEYLQQTEQDHEEIMAQNEELEASYGQLAAIEQEVRQQYDKLLEAEKELAYLSYHDQLTGLYNRRFFDVELERLDVPRNLPLSIIMADVNGLKLINDSFGHEAGDQLLINIAKVMKEGFREDDIIARLSGDEFVAILPNTSEKEAESIIGRIIHLSKDDKYSEQRLLSMELSIAFGIGTKTSEDTEMKDVFKVAEAKMYAQKIFEGQRMRSKAVGIMISGLHEKCPGENEHSNNVGVLSEKLGIELGFDKDRARELKTLGYLHDIGKIAISKSILNKTGELDPSEVKEVRKHPEIGYRILSTVNELVKMADHVLYHHERYDGEGYPKGLKGDEIPIEARIIAITEAYDTMSRDKPYARALREEEIIKELVNNAGSQFDPYLVKIFIEKVLDHNLK